MPQERWQAPGSPRGTDLSHRRRTRSQDRCELQFAPSSVCSLASAVSRATDLAHFVPIPGGYRKNVAGFGKLLAEGGAILLLGPPSWHPGERRLEKRRGFREIPWDVGPPSATFAVVPRSSGVKRESTTPGRIAVSLRRTRDPLDRMLVLARHREAAAHEILLEGVYYKVLDGPEPAFDPERDERAAKRRLAALADALRAEISRRGLTPADLDARLDWPEGRTESRLEEPSGLEAVELDLLCQELGTPIDELFETRPA